MTFTKKELKDMSFNSINSLVEVLFSNSARKDLGITFISGQDHEEFLSYHGLKEQAGFVLYNLTAAGVQPGDELILQLEDNRSFLLVFWACLIGRIIPVPLSFGGQDEYKHKLFAVWRTLKRPFLVTTDDQWKRIAQFANETSQQEVYTGMSAACVPMDVITKREQMAQALPEIRKTDIAYIQYSSGSTGNPKGVILTHENLLYNARDIVVRSKTTIHDKSLSWMPLTHDMGMICFHLSAVFAGIPQFLLPTPLFIRRPSLWLTKAGQHKVTQLYSPNFGYQYFLAAFSQENVATADLDLSAIRIIYNGAEPIDAAICSNFQHTLAPYGLKEHVCFPGYGLAEASVAVTLPVPGEALVVYYLNRNHLSIGDNIQELAPEDINAVSFVEVGYPIDHCNIRIAGSKDEWLVDGTVGHIQIRGLNVTAGYYMQPGATQELYTRDGWLRTGDVGFVRNRRLVITGRAKNILIINGQNYYPHDIERAVQEIPGMELGKVVACAVKQQDEKNDRLILFVLHKGTPQRFLELTAAAQQKIFEKTGLVAEHIVPVKKVPKTTSGKVQHFRLVEQFRAGHWDAMLQELKQLSAQTSQPTGETTSIGDSISRIWREITGQQVVDSKRSLLETSINSLLIMRFISLLGKSISRTLSIKDFFDHPSPEALEAFLSNTAVQPQVTYLLPADENSEYALTLTQQRFFMLQMLQPDHSPLNISLNLLLEAALDPGLLEAAALQLVSRHEALRTAFRLTDKGPRQYCTKEVAVSVMYRDLTATATTAVAALEMCRAFSRLPFDLENAPLWRIGLFKVAPGKSVLCIVMHHIISDGWTLLLVKNELAAIYHSLQPGSAAKPLLQPSPYSAYAAWYASWLSGEKYLADQQYWMREFDGFEPAPLFQPLHGTVNSETDLSSARIAFDLNAPVYAQLQQYCSRRRVSVFSALLTLISAWLYKYTGRTDLAIGTDSSGRLSAALEEIAGCFINTMVIRNRFSPDNSIGWLLAYTGAKIFDAYEHQLYPADLGNTGKAPVLDVLVLFQNFGEAAYNSFGDIRTSTVTLPVDTALANLSFEFIEQQETLTCHIDFRTGLFSKEQAAWFPGHFRALLTALLETPAARLDSIDMLCEEEKTLLVKTYNSQYYSPIYAESDVIRRFERMVSLTPHATAILFEGKRISYFELNEQVNRWTYYLKTVYGIGYGDRVGICLPRSEKALTAILATLKAGAAYVALDPDYPTPRLHFMIADSGIKLLLTTANCPHDLSTSHAQRVIWEQAVALLPGYPADDPGVIVSDTDEAYVIYTSGTSGQPKGVTINRTALYDYAQTVVAYFGINETDFVIQQSALSFDTLIEEVFPALCQGAAIHILREGGRDTAAILEAIAGGTATVLSTTPAVIAELNKHAAGVTPLRVLVSGGEVLKHTQVNHLLEEGVSIYNTYGPSETTVCACYYRVAPGVDIPIGRPVRNRKVYLLDENKCLVPAGATGEIYIGGTGVSSGYLHLPDATEQYFSADPFAPGRLYRTGDLGRWREDGNIEFLGRKDQQVKISGYRIETTEIEIQLAAHPAISELAVVAKPNRQEHNMLVCFYTLHQDTTVATLRDFAQEKLPFYMLPAVWVRLDALPLTGNGKVDRKALLAYEAADEGLLTAVAPANEWEAQLLEGWSHILNTTTAGVTDNFFEKGGNSLLATRLLLWVRQQWQLRLSLRDLFSNPTIRELAAVIAAAGRQQNTTVRTGIPVAAQAAHYPASYSQRRLWLLDSFRENKGAYNVSWAFRVQGALDREAFSQAFRWLLDRHEVLRTNFDFIDNAPCQIITDGQQFEIDFRDFSADPDAMANAEAYVKNAAVYPFDLKTEPLLKVGVIRLDDHTSLFVLVLHHIIGDAWSMDIISAELSGAYNAFAAGTLPDLPALPLQYKDFALWQQEQIESGATGSSAAYWLNRFKQDLPVLQLPEDKIRPAMQTYNGKTLYATINGALQQQLTSLAAVHSCGVFVVLLASVKAMLYRITGQTDLIIGAPVAGRVHPDLVSQVGFYVNTLPLRTQLSPADSFDALITKVKHTFLDAFEHQAYPFDLLVEELDLVRDSSRTPLFNVMVDLLNTKTTIKQPLQLQGLTLSPFPAEREASQFDLSFDFAAIEGELSLALNYNTDLFREESIQTLLDRYLQLLHNLVQHSSQPLDLPEYLPAAEKAALLEFSGQGQAVLPAPDLVTLFETTVQRYGHLPAVHCEGVELSYARLNEQANRLADCLVKDYGVRPGDRVGIMVNRNAWMIADVLGVLKAGAAYVPIDPEYASERVDYMLTDSGIRVLITDLSTLPFIREDITILHLAVFEATAQHYNAADPLLKPGTDDLAYLVYTSGSTGRPKGVMIAHRELLGLWDSLGTAYALDTFEVRLLQVASISFDVFFGDLLRSIFRGGLMVICPSAQRYDLPGFYELMHSSRITILESTPGLLLPLLDYIYEEGRMLDFMRILILGSDTLSVEDYRKVYERFAHSGLRIINSYGTTETTIDSSFYEGDGTDLRASGYVPIGRPLGNTRMYVLDQHLQLCGKGITGELCIGGAGVGRGYFGRTDLSAERFIENPYVAGERIYRTGDLARWTAEGNIEFLGRGDNQVKIRGYRIELGEVESVLLSYAGIREAVVLAYEATGSDKQLVSYIVWQGAADEAGLRSWLREKLPLYMHPSYYVTLERLPLTSNGKVDRKQLPAPQLAAARIYEGPRNATEATLVKIWEEVLQKQSISIYDNFFELGGHSLKGMRALWRIRKELGADLSFRDMFSYPRIIDLSELLSKPTETIKEVLPLTAIAPQSSYELSHAQRRMWLLDQLEEQGRSYTMPVQYRVKGALDAGLLASAFNRLIARHEILRTVFISTEGTPRQKVLEDVELALDYVDLREHADKEATLSACVNRIREAVFNLEQFPLLQAGLYRIADEEHVFVFNMHHIISDEWSCEVMVEELIQLYDGGALPALAVQYKDYSAWQHEMLQSALMERPAAYWKQQFADEVPVLNLPLDYARPAVKRNNGRTLHMELSKAQLQGLYELSHRSGSSLYMTLLASVKGLLYRYSGQEDIVIGSPVAGRSHELLSRQLGFYVNTLALRTRFNGAESFDALLKEVQGVVLSGFEHQDYPFDLLVEELGVQRDLSRSPLFDVMVVLQNKDYQGLSQQEWKGGLKWEECGLDTNISKFDLTLLFREQEAGLVVEVEYNTDLFSAVRMERFCEHYKMFVNRIIADSSQSLITIDYLPAAEKQQLLEVFNNTGISSYPSDRTIHSLFEETALRMGDKTAVVYEDRMLSYAELNRESNRVAGYLRREYGVRNGDLVGLMMDRSERLIICLLGILKAGAAYVPIDPAYPAARIKYMLEDSNPRVVLTDSLAATVSDTGSDIENLGVPVPGQSLAYVIYTSGSTGQPKGAMIAHHSVINLCTWLQEMVYAQHTAGLTALLTASVNFDASVQQLFAPLLSGSQLVMISEANRRQVEHYIQQLKQHRVSVIDITPGYLRVLLEVLKSSGTDDLSLQYILVGGETLPAEDRALFHEVFGTAVELINVYGVTEATVNSTYEIVTPGSYNGQCIGRPLKNTRMYVLDKQMGLCGIGIAGELCIGGVGVGLGYLGRTDLTVERFIENPYAEGECIYRTGDLARWTTDGNIEFLGRGDNQVKIRGYRIELGEVESVLLSYTGIREAVVLAYEATGSDKQLVSYIVWQGAADEAGLRSWLREKLPLYMHPSYYITLERLPLTSNGKVDRKQLPAPQLAAARIYEGPRNATETTLVKIWEEVLQKETISIYDNFFELGGHSLKGMRALWRIRKELGADLSFRDMFSYPRIIDLSELLSTPTGTIKTILPLTAIAPQSSYELSHAQRRMWLLDQLEEQGRSYTMPVQYRVKGALDAGLLASAFNRLIARHEILRTVFISTEGTPRQQVLEDVQLELDYADLREHTDKEATLSACVNRIREATFNLEQFPLLQAGLYRIADEEHVFVFNMHHIISDEWSCEVMVEELIQLYDGGALPALAVQYKDYSAWQHEMLQSALMERPAAYWKQQFADEVPVLHLPLDYARPAVKRNNGRTLHMELNKAQLQGLYELSHRSGSSLYMTLLASVKGLLYRYSGQEDIVIGSPVAGRSHELLSRQLGFYVNTLALRTRFNGAESFDALLKEVQGVVLSGFEHQDYPFDLLVEELGVQRDLSRSPLFDVMVVLQNKDYQGMSQQDWKAGLAWEECGLDTNISKFDLTLLFREQEAGLVVEVEYNTDLFSAVRMERFCEHYKTFVNRIIADSSQSLITIDYLPAAEKQQLLEVFNDTGISSYPSDRTIHSLFEETALRMGDKTAVVYEDRVLSYAELNRESNRVAGYLRREYGVRNGDLVGLMMDRSERLIICLLGILKAGAAYVPIDPAYPAARIKYMLEDSNPRVVLTDSIAATAMSTGPDVEYLDVPGNGRSLAYVIYTSGSTGQPKGVMVPHVGVVRLVHSPNYVTFSTGDRLLQTGSVSFDASTFEIWGMLLNGGTLYLLDHEKLMDTATLKYTIQSNGISMMWFSAPWFNQLADNDPSLFKGLQYILVGGDKLSARHINLVRALYPELHIINGYGPTENTTFSICYDIKEAQQGAVPLGKPVTGTRVYILDKQLQPVPVGCYGEIYLSGHGLAGGYLNMDDRSRERFVEHPFEPGAYMYRTGDLGRWNWQGEVEFAGRTDDQVKIRGFRIEPGEITNAILEYENIKDAIVIPFITDAGERELAAYLVWETQQDETFLRAFLRDKLPAYIQPGYYVTLEQLPLNANGKVDREALPAPETLVTANVSHEPRDERDAKLLVIWCAILQRNDIGIRDNFFEKGGHSLRASTLLTRIHKEFGVKISLSTLFRHNTIEELSAIIASTESITYESLGKAAVQPYYNVSHAQKRLWILDQLEDGSGAYNIPGAYSMQGKLNKVLLESALNVLVARHESLRTIFIKAGGEPKQQVIPEGKAKALIAFHDLTQDANRELTSKQLLDECIHRPFALHTWPLFRAMLIRMEAEQYVFVFCIHHIVSDGWSQGVIGKEISAIYNAMATSAAVQLPALPVQYKDYSEWHNRLLQGSLGEEAKKYWSDSFRKAVPWLNMPADRLRPRLQTFEGDVVKLSFEPAVTARLQQFGQEREATLFMSLLALVNTLLYRYTGVDDIVIASPIAAREHADLHEQIGFFANTLALRTRFSGEQPFETLLQAVKETTLHAYRYQMYPYDLVIEDAIQQYDPSHAALSDVMLVLQSNDAVLLDLQGMHTTGLDLSTNTARFDLVFIFTVENGSLCLDLGFNTNIYDKKRIEGLAQTLQTLMHSMPEQPALTVKELSIQGISWDDVSDKGVPLAVLNGHLVYGPEINAALEALPGIDAAWTQATDNKAPDVFIVPAKESAHTIQQLLKLRYEQPDLSNQLYTLPNGLPICYKNKTETDFTYKEVFEQHAYLKNGITLHPGDVIFDVGANIGMFSLYAGYHFPGCRVFAFEPIPPVYSYLAANAALYDMDIVALNMGLSNEATSAEFVYYPNNTIISGRFGNAVEDKEVVRQYLQNQLEIEGSTMSEKHMEEILDDMIRAETWVCRLSTLSAVIKEWNVTQIDLLKIDVEKSEWDILQGITAADWQRVRQVIVEVHDLDGRLERVKHLLEQQGFEVLIEQEEELAGTALYNIYAINHSKQRMPVRVVPIETGWTDLAAYCTHITEIIYNRLPAYLGAVKVHLADALPLDNAGNPDPVKIDLVKAYSATLQGMPQEQATGLQLAIAATFTADPLSDYISWWTDRFGIPVQVKQAPYNQVFQELLQEESLLSRNPDINLLLVRWEDWIRDARGSEKEQMELVEYTFQQLVSILTAKNKQALYLVGIIPPQADACHSNQLYLFLERINQQWVAALQQMKNVRIVDFTDIPADFGITEVYDPQRDKLGHIPFHEAIYAAMGTVVARQIRAYKQPSFKLIVLDCDNTLWSGVCGEDGVDGIQLHPEHIFLQRFMQQKKQEGFLLALCSKNNEADVWEVFDKHPGMVLRKHDFVTTRINWNSKAVNLLEMAAELNIGINACCLIDDSPMECSAVAAACSDVLVLQLPENTAFIPQWLAHVWAFDKFMVTEEDRERTAMYKAEKERKQLLDTKPSMNDFLAQLQLQLSMQNIQEQDIPRIAQLTERTNQFNLNGIRRTEQEIARYIHDSNYHCKAIRVKDKFGDYGLTGLLITTAQEDTLYVDTFLLSCRVLGRQVEQGVLGVLKQQAVAGRLQKIAAGFIKTNRNKPFLQFLEATSWSPAQTTGTFTVYEILPEQVPDTLPLPEAQLQTQQPVDAFKQEQDHLLFDHIGVAVIDLDKSLPFYTASGFTSTGQCYDPIQNVKIHMCRTADGGGIELIAPYDEHSPVNNIIRHNGDQPYHFCYRVKQLDALFNKLQQEGVAFEIVKQPEQAVLFNNKRIVFINIHQAGLVEFIEDPDMDSLPPQKLPAEMEISLVTFDVQPALQFFRLAGYREIKQVTDHVNKAYTITLHAQYSGAVLHLIMPLANAGTESALFLQRNGVHIFRLLLHTAVAEKYPQGLLPAYFMLAGEKVNTVPEELEWEPSQELNKEAPHYALHLPLYYNNGRKLLQIPVYQVQKNRPATALRAPETDTEKALFRIWETVLRHQAFGVHTSFLEAGGNSIKATQVLSRIYRQYGVELLLTDFFNKPTIQALAALVEKKQPQGFESITPLPLQTHYPLSFSQKQLWISDQFESASGAAFNIPVAYVIQGPLDPAALTAAFHNLVERHEILRTIFVKAGDEVRQQVLTTDECRIQPEWTDLTAMADAEEAALRIANQEPVTAFNLETGPLLRIKVLRTGQDRHLLLFTTHHIVSDGWSSGIMLKEVAALYNAQRRGKATPLHPLRIQYKDYAGWQLEQMQQPAFEAHKKYWLQQFQDGTPVLQLPYDFPRPAFKSYNGHTLSFSLGSATAGKIKGWMEQQEVSLFMCFVAVTKMLLYRLSGQQELVVGFPISGRQHPELEDQVGCYVNTIALCTRMDTQMSLPDFVRHIKENITHAYSHAAYPFERLVEELGGHTDLGRSPLFDVMVQIQDAHLVHQQDAGNLEGLDIRLFEQALTFSKYDLTVNVMETQDDITIDLEYNTDLFRQETVAGIQADFIRLLNILLSDTPHTLRETRILLTGNRGNEMQQYQQSISASIDESF